MADTEPIEPNGANRELKRRLKAATDRQGLSQADVVKRTQRAGEEIGKATVSNALNPEKGPPSLFTLTALLNALGISGSEREKLLRLRARADSRSTARLEMYLEGAERLARQHPYPELPGKHTPLANIYLPQQARLLVRGRNDDGQPRSADSAEVLMAAEVLERGEACVVFAEPGGGKSSLLRTHLAASAERWRAGVEVTAIPVLVSAAALAGLPLPEALAGAVNAERWKTGMPEDLTAGFFRSPPEPKVPWLVMVDGLDEIVDTGTRQEVLRTLAAWSEQTSLHRFIVATRPLPSDELDALGQHLPIYQLEPFNPDDLLQAVRRWFHALKVSAPDEEASRFISAIDRRHLTEVARRPLMTAMLCQLHASQSAGLPGSRGEIYQRFIGLLHNHQHANGISGIEPQTRAALEHWGSDAVSRAERTLDRLPKLLSYLAAEQYDGNTQPALDILTLHPDAQPPERLSEYNTEVWRNFLSEALRRSGLLTLCGAEFVFLHQTFLEYFAARHAKEVLAHTINTRLKLEVVKWPPAREAGTGDLPVRSSMAWVPPPFQTSYLGFLIDLAHEDPGMNRLLMRWATDALDGCEFIARQVHLGTRLPAGVTDAAASTLHALARDTLFEYHNRIRAVDALVELGSQRAHDLLYDLGLGTSFNAHVRLYRIAGGLAQIESQRAVDLFRALEQDSTVDHEHRQFAYVRLCWLTGRVPEQFTGET
ncbi:NACHT domain-containing protein [Streptomyces sp. NPDC014685]|uniref:NACHT domain-containing protein n=1 Tax=Streptomyces sp. NPDC014685 TaxID=3364881 RepID=UPI0036F58C3A